MRLTAGRHGPGPVTQLRLDDDDHMGSEADAELMPAGPHFEVEIAAGDEAVERHGVGTRVGRGAIQAPQGEVPAIGRFNSDGRADIATFARNGAVYVGASNGANAFGSALWHSWFGDANDTLLTGDVNGDGRDDLVAFTQDQAADVWVALSSGSGFGTVYKAHEFFAP